MNDFTKFELQIMLLEMNISIKRNKDLIRAAPSYKALMEALMDKLEAMIDNYCEHTNKNYDMDGGITLVCSDCGCTLIDV